MIITRFSRLIREYHRLAAGDVFVGQVPSSFLKSALLADLCDRGIRLVPSATAQVLNASKVAQAFLLNPWMVPHTFAITRRRELLDAISTYNELGVSSAVTKADCLHCGHGVRKWDNLEIRIYEGANGEFTLYEDENDNYNYEKGMYSTITFTWNDTEKILTINKREGSFPGMMNERIFNLVLVSKNKGNGMNKPIKYDKVVPYKGQKIVINL